MIPEDKLKEIRKALEESARPLIFFDDDPDGMCSFLQFYKLNTESKGIIYKVAGPLDEKFLPKVEEIQPDAIFILDVNNVSQNFLDKVKNVYWIDHHSILDRKNVRYYNPMIESKGMDNRPISYWSYRITESSLWLAMAGCVGDWFIPEDLREKFSLEYPELLPKDITKPEDALFKSDIGKLSRIFSFILKGKTNDAMGCVKTMTRIKDPYEILCQTTSQGRFIWKKYQKIDKGYQEIRNTPPIIDGELVIFIYHEHNMAMTSELSNELLYEHPGKFIIVGREKGDEYKLSLRSSTHKVLHILEKALDGVNGFGGGHLHACGANVKKEDFQKFVENIKNQL